MRGHVPERTARDGEGAAEEALCVGVPAHLLQQLRVTHLTGHRILVLKPEGTAHALECAQGQRLRLHKLTQQQQELR